MSGNTESAIGDLNEDELSRRWRDETKQYVTAINRYVQRGMDEGWDKFKSSDEPKDNTEPMAEAVMNAIRRANQSGDVNGLHERFPRAHSPFLPHLEKDGQSLPVAMLLDDGRIVLRIGATYETGHFVIVDGNSVEELPSTIVSIGRSPNREFFAIAQADGISITHGWNGPISAVLKWPTGMEGMPQGFDCQPIQGLPTITRIIPFDTGDKLLLVSPEGIFVLTRNEALRLLPTEDELREHFEFSQKEYPDDPLALPLDMEHGAISPDGKFIAAGHQSSLHYVFDADSYDIVAEIGHMSEYPHYAAFSNDGTLIAFNSCHFYGGMTIGVPTNLIPGIKTDRYEVDDRCVLLEQSSRVYAAISRQDEFVIGDASGYLRAFDFAGNFRWRHFIGSTVGDIDISRDGKRLIVTTYAGFLCILDLDTGDADPFVIGTSTHREVRRWLFWKTEPKPLIW